MTPCWLPSFRKNFAPSSSTADQCKRMDSDCFSLEDGVTAVLRKVTGHAPKYTASHARTSAWAVPQPSCDNLKWRSYCSPCDHVTTVGALSEHQMASGTAQPDCCVPVRTAEPLVCEGKSETQRTKHELTLHLSSFVTQALVLSSFLRVESHKIVRKNSGK
jgi:hypothetical protein